MSFKTAMGRILSKPGNQRNKEEEAEAEAQRQRQKDDEYWEGQDAQQAQRERDWAEADYNTFLVERDQFLNDHGAFADAYCRRSNCSVSETYHKKEYERRHFNERSVKDLPSNERKRKEKIKRAEDKWALNESQQKRIWDAEEPVREEEFKAQQIRQLAKMKAAFRLGEGTKSVEEGSKGEDTDSSSADESDP